MNFTFDPFNGWVLLLTFITVLIFMFVPYLKTVATWFVTIIHEAGHAIFSLLTGNGISAIRLHKDGSGSTDTLHVSGLFSRLFRIIVLFAGYTAPIYLGFGLIMLNLNDLAMVAFYILLVIGLLTLVFLRSWFGIIILAIYFLSLFAVMVVNNGATLPLFVNFLGFLFVALGLKDLIQVAGPVFMKKKYSMSASSDFHILQEESLFHIPAQAWYVFYVIINGIILGSLITFAVQQS